MPDRRFLLLPVFLRLLFIVGGLQLPDTSGIDGQLTVNHAVDQFFSLWLVFNSEAVNVSDQPFTIFAVRNSVELKKECLLSQPDLVKNLLLDHIVIGEKLDLNKTNGTAITATTASGKTVRVKETVSKEGAKGSFVANDANVLERGVSVPNGHLIILDRYLFPDATLKIGKNCSTVGLKEHQNVQQTTHTTQNGSFIDNVMQVLSLLKSGVRVFQHFLSRSNVSRLIDDDAEYTVFIPTDHAFQRWHPIDWGFYPFSVPEFTESIIVNHFVKGKLKQDGIKNGETVKTLGGREVTFKKNPSLLVNGASVIKGDTPISKGNIMFIAEVLFVSEAVVSRLHQQHRDKETPPLLAFPWFGAQFLSHAFLALERDKRFTHITRFLNLADLAPHVSGTGYTFFVPMDSAFEELGLDKMPDNYLSTGSGLQILLNHFVKGRLYDKDLKDGILLKSLGDRSMEISRDDGVVKINNATIIESEVFVYNLGTMFYIDKVLFVDGETLPIPSLPITTPKGQESEFTETTTIPPTEEVEKIPDELTEDGGMLPDVLYADATTNDFETETTSEDISELSSTFPNITT
ncbi:periostin [Onthophagus taurus]|uniref:periostin n=1 Tax=Onthophagus taurus TaxID=166361 RepID=UPI000C20350C|nr:transforming growth factor-beta-induced protein ig-h3 [Onthophagus taurus]